MEIIIRLFHKIWREFLFIFLYVFVLNVYIGKQETTINADGIGYYEYLPSLFIHQDMNRHSISFDAENKQYKRIKELGMYVDYEDKKINKYPCGTALLQLPFFTYTYLTTDLDNNLTDGYQKPFQKMVFLSCIFYLFLGLIFLRNLLTLFEIKEGIITFIQLLIVLGTGVTHYANMDASFSHIYSFFAVNAFLYFTKSYFKHHNFKHFLWACAFFGLIMLLRQINILVLCFVPFIVGSFEILKEGFIRLFQNWKTLLIGISITGALFFIQSILWYLQVGKFFVYSYQGEGFNFLSPQAYKQLFSYEKGLFVYTPVLMFTMIGPLWLFVKKQYYLSITWLFFFFVLVYILSSWSCWNYGCSFGLRAYVDFYTVFFIPFALMLNTHWNAWRIVVSLLCILAIPVNVIQTYQYKNYILHWFQMDEMKYWKVFLKTDPKYAGLVWKNETKEDAYTILKEYSLGDLHIQPKTAFPFFMGLSTEIPSFSEVNFLQITFENDFKDEDDSRFNISIKDTVTNTNHFWTESHFIHFSEEELNKWQKGSNRYEFIPITDGKPKNIEVYLITNEADLTLKNVKVKFLKNK